MHIFGQITYGKQFAEAIKKAYKPVEEDQGNRHLTLWLSRESKTP